MNLTEKIRSIKDVVGHEFTRPDPTKLEQLKLTKEANEYLHGRGITDETISHFQLGYDPVRNAISIPIFKEGELVNIKYRFLEPENIKYSSERNAETWIYNEEGIQQGLKQEHLVVVEGEFDAMLAWQHGIKNVVAPASGKDSYGVWLELIDPIPKVYLAYDNDKGGQESSQKLADRIGVDKCFSVQYPKDDKDANDFFLHAAEKDFRDLLKKAKPFYSYQYKGLGDIIELMREDKGDTITTSYMPKVEMEKGWMVMISGKSNVGKTAYVLNVADELTQQNIPTLVLPFERGIETVGKRYLQVQEDKPAQEFTFMNDDEYRGLITKCVGRPLYFAMPKKDEIQETIIKAKRLFNTRVVIVDHLDYMIRHVSGNKENEIADTLQEFKRIAEEHGIVMLIVSHLRKTDMGGQSRTPHLEDLKGSSSLYQDPECVVMLYEDVNEHVKVDIQKNKGEMTYKYYDMNKPTGKLREIQLSEIDQWDT